MFPRRRHCINSVPTCGLHHSRYRRQNIQSWGRPHSVGKSVAASVTKPSSVCLLLLAQHGWRWDAFNLPWTCAHGGKVRALCVFQIQMFFNQQCRESAGLVRRPSLIMQVLQQKRLWPLLPPADMLFWPNPHLVTSNTAGVSCNIAAWIDASMKSSRRFLAKKVEIVRIAVSWPEIWVEEANAFVTSFSGIFTDNTRSMKLNHSPSQQSQEIHHSDLLPACGGNRCAAKSPSKPSWCLRTPLPGLSDGCSYWCGWPLAKQWPWPPSSCPNSPAACCGESRAYAAQRPVASLDLLNLRWVKNNKLLSKENKRFWNNPSNFLIFFTKSSVHFLTSPVWSLSVHIFPAMSSLSCFSKAIWT